MKNYYLLLMGILSISVNAQSVSGSVKDASGKPIVNALVCQVSKPTVFKKTDANGAYTIAGTSSTALRVGALGYKTIPSTTAKNITMAVDPLLSTDVFHISFDHLRSGPSYTDTELKKDFNSAYGGGFYDGSSGSDRASVDYGVSKDPVGVSLKVKFPKGKLKTASSGVDTRIPLKGTYKDNTFQSTDLYISYWVKFSDNFEFSKCGGKLPSLGGSTPGTRDEDRWKGRIMWRKGGSIQFYMELPDNSFNIADNLRFWGNKIKEGSGICDFQYQSFLGAPGWHNIELHYKFETPGKNDGIFEGWVDGVNHYSINATVFNNYRPAGTTRSKITINYLLLSSFLGGSDLSDYAPTADTYAWFDEFRVSAKRINELKVARTSDLTIDDNNAKKEISIHPNPSTGLFTLDEIAQWSVFDVYGKTINQGKSKNIDLSGNAKGIYFAKINDNEMKKLIVQ
jgi:hypothetical protein